MIDEVNLTATGKRPLKKETLSFSYQSQMFTYFFIIDTKKYVKSQQIQLP